MEGPGEPLGAGSSAGAFSVREFARTAIGDYRAQLDFADFDASPTSAALASRLRTLAAIERATMLHLRRILVTPTHKDARVTAFLTTWAYEKYWISDALRRIAGPDSRTDDRHARGGPLHIAKGINERLSPIGRALVTNVIGTDFIGVHLATATSDEIITQALYRGLAEDPASAPFRSAFELFLTTKSRHLDFLEGETCTRLSDNSRARRLTRLLVPHATLPIGADELPRSAVGDLFSVLRPEALPALDTRISSLPGLSGTRIASRSVGRSGRGSAARRGGRQLGQLAGTIGGLR